MTKQTEDILKERQGTHGDFANAAVFVQHNKTQMHGTPNWHGLYASQKEALDMITHKIGRILYGDADHVDHWDDIAGYAKLVSKFIATPTTQFSDMQQGLGAHFGEVEAQIRDLAIKEKK